MKRAAKASVLLFVMLASLGCIGTLKTTMTRATSWQDDINKQQTSINEKRTELAALIEAKKVIGTEQKEVETALNEASLTLGAARRALVDRITGAGTEKTVHEQIEGCKVWLDMAEQLLEIYRRGER